MEHVPAQVLLDDSHPELFANVGAILPGVFLCRDEADPSADLAAGEVHVH